MEKTQFYKGAKKLSLFIVLGAVINFNACSSTNGNDNYVSKVDPFIGTDYHGHVFLGASTPFGMLSVGPNNPTQGWDWCSGYHYSDSILLGFSHLHLSGTGIGDYGDLAILPISGNLKEGNLHSPSKDSNYYSKYSHSKEIAQPGYYETSVERYGVKAKLTATQRVAFHNYSYTNNEKAIIVNLKYGTGWDTPMKASLKQIDDTTIVGYRLSTGWAKDQRFYFVIRSSEKIQTVTRYVNSLKVQNNSDTISSNDLVAQINFAGKGEELNLKVAISHTSIENAIGNLNAESIKDFAQAKSYAQQEWDKELKKIEFNPIDGVSEKIFYTSLYHTMLNPSIFNDVNGDYRGADGKIYNSKEDKYTVFSLWDTYRALHPLLTITSPERVTAMMNTMVDIYLKQGKLPVWHLAGNETECMVGNPAIPVLVDAVFKEIKGIDPALILQAADATMKKDMRGLDHIKARGYIAADTVTESVALGLEYAVAEEAIFRLATKLNSPTLTEEYLKRSQNYKLYFDKEVGFFRGRLASGEFRKEFSPIKSIHRADDFCEGNAWQYLWLVPTQVDTLVSLLGGEAKFDKKLDELFSMSSDLGEGASSDITGMIGMYAHGNEPNHHIPYLYSYIGKNYKSAPILRRVMDSLYTDKPDGLCGNEDCGQMSAWYVFSSLGFYPVDPTNGVYIIGTPLFKTATINLEGGKKLELIANNNSKENMYIEKIIFNGTPFEKAFITHKEIMAGGKIEFFMSKTANPNYGFDFKNRP